MLLEGDISCYSEECSCVLQTNDGATTSIKTQLLLSSQYWNIGRYHTTNTKLNIDQDVMVERVRSNRYGGANRNHSSTVSISVHSFQ